MTLTKKELRKVVANILARLSDAEKIRQSHLVSAKLFEHSKYKQANRLSLYLSTQNEIDTRSILKRALEIDQKRCFIPLIRNKKDNEFGIGSRMTMVELRSMQEYENLPINKYGIKEPLESDFEKLTHAKPNGDDQLDLIIVPGVAFTLDGRRLGHGKGYYDEYLTSWNSYKSSTTSDQKLFSIGLALRQQILEDLTVVEEHDVKLDEVIFAD